MEPARSQTKPIMSDRGLERLLPQVYEFLVDVLRMPNVDDDYGRALCTVLDAAHTSEQTGFPVTLLPFLTFQAAG